MAGGEFPSFVQTFLWIYESRPALRTMSVSTESRSSHVTALNCLFTCRKPAPAALPASTDQVAAERVYASAHRRERRRRAPRTLGASAVTPNASALLLGGPGRPCTDPCRDWLGGALGRQLAGGVGGEPCCPHARPRTAVSDAAAGAGRCPARAASLAERVG